MRVRAATLALVATLTAAASVSVSAFAATEAVGAPPATDATQPYVLYYTAVGTYQGKRETLWTIAGRLLGDANRAGEILELNSGHVQPDGARLTDPGTLHAGWQIVLPWDAVGSDVHYGALPTVTAKPSTNASTPPPRQAAQQPAPGHPPKAGATPSTGGCRQPRLADLAWGQRLLDPGRVWQSADGNGIRIAVVDSGVDGTRAELADRVVVGADIVRGTGRGNTDCLGTGTGVALIAAADDGAGGRRYGIAPKAVIVPIRVVDRTPTAPAKRAATAIQVAVSTGVQVIVLGSYVDVSDQGVRKSVHDAIAHNVVVVMPARTVSTPPTAVAGPEEGLLRVGGVDEDREPVGRYPAAAVDLVGPGSAPYAAAFVAGTVALVQSRHPGLGAVESARQVLRTATSWQQPGRYGAGLVSPFDAVGRPLPADVQHELDTAVQQDDNDELIGTIGFVLVVVLVALLVLYLWVRHMRLARVATLARERETDSEDDPFHERSDAALIGSGTNAT